jgi:hypothetical protein
MKPEIRPDMPRWTDDAGLPALSENPHGAVPPSPAILAAPAALPPTAHGSARATLTNLVRVYMLAAGEARGRGDHGTATRCYEWATRCMSLADSVPTLED